MAEDVLVPAAQVPRKGRSVVVDMPPPSTGSKEGIALKQGIAVFNTGEGFYAVENRCPHKGWPLARGALEGCEVRCPWHGWCIDLKSGKVKDMEDFCCPTIRGALRRPKAVETFSVRREGDGLVVTRTATPS